MDYKKYRLNQLKLEEKAMKEFYALENPTQNEKDLFNLRMILYSIKPQSLWWRMGVCSTLKRVIKELEKRGN